MVDDAIRTGDRLQWPGSPAKPATVTAIVRRDGEWWLTLVDTSGHTTYAREATVRLLCRRPAARTEPDP